MKERKGFTFLRKYRDLATNLNDAQRLVLYEATMSFFLDGVVLDIGELNDVFYKIRHYQPTKKKRHKKKVRKIKNVDDYHTYLRSRHWQNFRGHMFTIQKKCQLCGSTEKLQVHHKWYGTRKKSILYRETKDDVVVLCDRCHQKYHKEYDRATKSNYSKFYKKNKKDLVVRVVKKDGSVIDMAKAVEVIKRKNTNKL